MMNRSLCFVGICLVMCTLQSRASDGVALGSSGVNEPSNCESHEPGYIPYYQHTEVGDVYLTVVGADLLPSKTYTIHRPDGTWFKQVHTDSSGNITDGSRALWGYTSSISPGNGSYVVFDLTTGFCEYGTADHPAASGGREVTLSVSTGPCETSTPSSTHHDVEITIALGGAAACPWSFDVDLTRGCVAGPDHEIEIRVGSEVVGGGTWPSGVEHFTGEFSGTNDTGGVVALFVDGVQMGSGHDVTCYGDPPPGNAFVLTGTFGGSCSPTPSPTPPSPSPTPPSPSPTPPPPGGTPPSGSPYPGVDPPGGDPPPGYSPPPAASPGAAEVRIMNMDEFYDAVKGAIQDSGSAHPGVTFTQDGFSEVDLSDRGKLDEIAGLQSRIKTAQEGVSDKLNSAVANLKTSFSQIEAINVGQSTTVNIPIPEMLGGGNMVVDLAEFSAECNLIRTLLLWLVMVSMAFLYMQALTYQYD